MGTGFKDRIEGGRQLARALQHYANRGDVVVLALPRGGVPVAFEVARHLHAPLDIFLVRKLGVPGHEEYAMGAIASGGAVLVNDDVVKQLGISDREVDWVIEKEKLELARRESAYRRNTARVDLRGRTVILVDDGLATGSTMKAAVKAVRQHDPRHVVVAVPVAPLSAYSDFKHVADEFVSVLAPEVFFAVGQWYQDFAQTTDEEVCDLLERSVAQSSSHPAPFPLI